MWYQKIQLLFKDKDLRSRILFILMILAVYRLMANIPIPGIDLEKLREFFSTQQAFGETGGGGAFGPLNLYNLFVGGALSNLSVIMLGLGPYITSVIIFQLLTLIFPQLEKMYKEEGEAGKQKFNQYGRIMTIPLAALQGYGMLTLLQKQGLIGSLSPVLLFSSILTITGGAILLMWFGELISEKGIGNGISLLIFAGIVARFSISVRQAFVDISMDPSRITFYLIFFALALFIIAGVVLITEARRNIPVSYTKRVRGFKMYGGVSTYLPLNINPAGVMPIIFAMSILLFPSMIGGFLGGSQGTLANFLTGFSNFFNPQLNPFGYGAIYFILVVLFTYFYTAVTFNPKSVSTNLQKMGGFIPGIRPGEKTANYLKYILNRVEFTGAVFLGLIAVLPSIIGGFTGITGFTFLIGGTSILIMVSVVLETYRSIKAQIEMREYESF